MSAPVAAEWIARLRAATPSGAVSFIQRFGDALHMNVHFHSLALGGV